MYKNKDVKVILSEEANDVYDELNKIVGGEIKKGVDSSFHQTLLRSIKRIIETLKDNPFAGDQVRKTLIPPKYIVKYEINNVLHYQGAIITLSKNNIAASYGVKK